MAGNDGWGCSIWKQMQQVRVTRNDGIQAPIRANGKDGIRIGVVKRLKLFIARG
jgi:hypothetical protein